MTLPISLWHGMGVCCAWWWCGVVSNIVGRINEVTLRRAWLVLGWVTVFGGQTTSDLSISPSHPGQLSLLLSAGREISTSQSAVMLCGWGVKTCMVHSTCGWTCGWQVKLCDPLLTRAMPEHFRDESW